MSGSKQHYIPRSLLRGFLSHSKGESEYVWLFRKGAEPCNPELGGTATQRHFYSELPKDGEKTLDTRITAYETRLAELLVELRSASIGEQVSSDLAAEVVTHLVSRNVNFRDAMVEGVRSITLTAFGLVTDERRIKGYLGLNSDAPSEKFNEYVSGFLATDARFVRLGFPLPLLERIVFIHAKETFTTAAKDRPPLGTMLAHFYGQADQFVRESHNRALEVQLVPSGRLDGLKKLIWAIEEAEDDFILPDCVALGITADKKPHPLFALGEDEIATAVMPLNTRKLLVGRCEGAEPFYPLVFNLLAGACSHQFFISNKDTSEVRELAKPMGVWSRTHVQEAISGAAKELTTRFPKEPEPIVIEPPTETNEKAKESQPFTYQLSFVRFASEEDVRVLSEPVQTLISAAFAAMPLTRLDGVTVAYDFDTAVRDVDRGYPISLEGPSVKRRDGYTAYANSVMIKKDDLVKIRIVICAGVAKGLIGEDEDAKQFAEHTFIYELAQASFIELYDRAFPGHFLAISENWIDWWRWSCVEPALGAYIAARQSAPFYPEKRKINLTLLSDSIDAALAVIKDTRLQYRFHGNLEKLLTPARAATSSILKYCAEMIGHGDGLEQPDTDDAAVLALLEKLSLGSWYKKYKEDMRVVWASGGKWTSYSEIENLFSHAERVMWTMGVFPWLVSPGQYRVEVPIKLDHNRLFGAVVRNPLAAAKLIWRNLWKKFGSKTP